MDASAERRGDGSAAAPDQTAAAAARPPRQWTAIDGFNGGINGVALWSLQWWRRLLDGDFRSDLKTLA
ncbi:hypothetical protein E3N88_33797 [Mikania micrantha]|uniref:Uncharacterized protein n=1 Tax=Mikania micrantha TaxID=192012 RepID=A0A5N6MCZ1_9ASTR|nr:hypothetical protein E3N88_33797 [Mikania micrantha]